MAVPWVGWLAEENMESGSFDTAVWNGTNVDTQSKLAIRHYTTLINNRRIEVPYRGAYAAELDLSLGTANAYQESTLWVGALSATLWTRFYLCTNTDLKMATGDSFSLLQLQSATAVVQGMVGIKKTSNDVQIYAANTQTANTTVTSSLIPGQWHCIELKAVVDSGAADGTLTLYVDGPQVGSAITGLTQSAIAQARLGAMTLNVGTTAGILLFDQVIASTARAGPHRERFPQTVVLTKSGHVAVGNGSYEDAYLMPGGATNNHLLMYDTDEANIVAEQSYVSPDIVNSANNVINYYIASRRDGHFHRGLYVQLTGTNPRAYVVLRDALISEGAIRAYAERRRRHAAF